MEEKNKLTRDFKLTSWAINNKNTIYLAIGLLLLFGFFSYTSLPKELFPDINYPTVFVNTVYPGNSSSDVENLLTKPLEKELKTLKDVNRLRSVSAQDASMLFIEYKPNVDIDEVFQDVKDAVDRAKGDLPDDLPADPMVIEFNLSEFPVVTVNLSGNYNLDELKGFADYLADELETVSEVSSVEIQGISEKEIQVNVDMHKLSEMNVSFNTIANAIKFENITMSAGDIKMGDIERSIRIVGEYNTVDEIQNIIVKSENGKPIYLRDVAEVKETYSETESYTRLWGNPVISLQVIKKNGENVINCVDNTLEKIEEAKKAGKIPNDLVVTITNNQSKNIKFMLSNLENNIIMGVILVVLILMLFLGLRNAILVGFSIPMSMLMSFAILNAMGESVNMITLFSMILALGMLVDNAIVVVENIYRFVDKGYKVTQAAKLATSEVAVPIIASTLTTLAAFFPLIFWNDLMGEFMKLLPITLIIVLSSSLFNALVFTPVLSRIFVKNADKIQKPKAKKTLIWSGILIVLSIPLYISNKFVFANFFSFSAALYLLYAFVFFDLSKWVQNKFLVWLEEFYLKFIRYSLRGKKPALIIGGVVVLLFATMIFYFGVRRPHVVLFPNNQPQYFNLTVELPIGTTLEYTDSIMDMIEDDLDKQLKPYENIIDSKLVNVGSGVQSGGISSLGNKNNKGQITINFVDFIDREGFNTSEILIEISEYFKNRYAGINVTFGKNRMGPPSGSPINIELKGDDMDKLIQYSDSIITKIDQAKIPGIENLALDIETGKPDLVITVDKEKAGIFGVTTAQVASTIRTSLFGNEVSKFKTEDDEYPIIVRFSKQYRNNLSSLLNQQISFRNSSGKEVVIPISAVATIKMSNSFSSIRHIDRKRTLTISSNVLEGYNANDINQLIKAELSTLKFPEGYTVSYTGEQEDMKSSMEFIQMALLIAVALILIILVTQFNSIIKPVIILASVLFSTIGVFGGLATFNMDFVIIMTGVGIISLAGIVVNNAIVLIDYIDFLKQQRKNELELDSEEDLPLNEIIECIVIAGKTRLRPVLLTAITTVLGLISLAIGLNIDFGGLLSNLKPEIYLGGDNVGFWGPMAWTVIFGLTFATFMTLVVVPAMYLVGNRVKLKFSKEND
ncbi:MAG: efflux RND transporter permease subunit [Bacteroidales bacterium]|nr:efflux RND transporter permease subunit [Bacteroidales bacterium]